MITPPDHVVHGTDFDALSARTVRIGIALLRERLPDLDARNDGPPRSDAVLMRGTDPHVHVNVFLNGPVVTVVVQSVDGDAGRIRFSLDAPFGEDAFDAVAADPRTGLAAIADAWDAIAAAPPRRTSDSPAMAEVFLRDDADRALDAAVRRSMARAAASILAHNPRRSPISLVRVDAPCLARPGVVTNDRNRATLAAALERAIVADVPDVVVLGQPRPAAFSVSALSLVQPQGELCDGSPVSIMRLVDGLPHVPRPLLGAGRDAT